MMKSSYEGYTLIEILVVITITAILFTAGYANFRDYTRRQALVSAARILQVDLRAAQEQATAGKKPNGCTGSLTGYKFTVDSTSSYKVDAACSGGDVTTKQITLAPGVRVDTPSLNPILFKSLALGTNIQAGSLVLIVLNQTSTGQYRSVEIQPSGAILESNATPGPTSSPSPSPSPIPTATPWDGWTFCANENGYCYLDGTKSVRYGANGSYFYKTLTNFTYCTNQVFGDPAFGISKSCYFQ